jgi:hypothetical protein
MRYAERNLGICRRLTDSMPDRCDDRIWHANFELVIARVCAIARGYEDAIDLDGCGMPR